MTRVPVRVEDDAEAVVLPRRIAELIGLSGDGTLTVTGTDKGLLMAAEDAELARQLEIGERIMERYAETFRRLAR